MISAASSGLVGGDLPDERPADTPTPRGEGAGLSAPAAAAKEEQLAQHRDQRYQPPAPRVGPGAVFSGAGGGIQRARGRYSAGPGRYSVAPPAESGLAVRMHIEQADPADPRQARQCHEVYLAAQRADEPGPWFTDRAFGGWLAVGWGGDPREVWLATEDGTVTGWYRL